jgi:hypothetical protein
MIRERIKVPKLGEPSPYVCRHCDKTFANKTLEDQSKIHRHLILHVPDSTMRWTLMDDWRAAHEGRDSSNPAFS